MDVIRSILFAIFQTIFTIVYASVFLLIAPFLKNDNQRFSAVAHWNKVMRIAMRIILNIEDEVIGIDQLPNEPVIFLSNHQSAWETITLIPISKRLVSFLMKRELLMIPFFGWSLARIGFIPIDRSKGIEAFDRLVKASNIRIQEGRSIIIFPEGTRKQPGKLGKFKTGGARLAIGTGVPIVPVAHNAGSVWPKNSFIKHSGKITMVFGSAIYPEGKSIDELTQEVHTWIANELHRIDPETYPAFDTIVLSNQTEA